MWTELDELKRELSNINTTRNYTYSITSRDDIFILTKQFHQSTKRAKTTRFYKTVIFEASATSMLSFIKGLAKDKEYI